LEGSYLFHSEQHKVNRDSKTNAADLSPEVKRKKRIEIHNKDFSIFKSTLRIQGKFGLVTLRRELA
jgi:hypothetical protein